VRRSPPAARRRPSSGSRSREGMDGVLRSGPACNVRSAAAMNVRPVVARRPCAQRLLRAVMLNSSPGPAFGSWDRKKLIAASSHCCSSSSMIASLPPAHVTKLQPVARHCLHAPNNRTTSFLPNNNHVIHRSILQDCDFTRSDFFFHPTNELKVASRSKIEIIFVFLVGTKTIGLIDSEL
jgi:hypothetical protein